MATSSRALVVAIIVLVAGCGSIDTAPESGTASRTGQVVVAGGDLPEDPQSMYRQMAEVHGTDLRGHGQFAFHVRNDSAEPTHHRIPFERVWGISESAPNATVGLHRFRTMVPLDRLHTRCDRIRWIAHELASRVQSAFETGSVRNIPATVDGWATRQGIRLGVPAFAASHYLDQYTDCEPTTADWADLRPNLTIAEAFVVGQYHFGKRYVSEQIDTPKSVESVFVTPPWTTEQLIHGYGFDAERPLPLPVGVRTAGGWDVNDSRTGVGLGVTSQSMGELFVRVLLEQRLALDRAASAAAGWGNDTVIRLERGETTGYAWILRWDTERDADEFAAAMRAYLNDWGNQTDDGWVASTANFDVRRQSADTVVVLAGGASFLTATAIDSTANGVMITVGETESVRRAPAV